MNTIATRAVAACAALLTIVAGTAGAAASAGAQEAADAPSIDWTACTSTSLLTAGAECGSLAVPLDHDDPDGEQITIAVSRIRASAPAAEQQGPLLMNPGGPGGSGLTLPAFFAQALPADVATTYDLIGFDPRGVGSSEPALSCIPDYGAGPRPAFDPIGGPGSKVGPNEREWLDRSKAYAEACAEAQPELLEHLTTADAVADIELIRRALDAEKINFYGFSYGTYLGQVYATLYPDRTRRLVLDGLVDPRLVWYDAQLAQDKAFERAMTEFWAWVADHDDVYGLGANAGEVEKRFHAERDALEADPQGVIGPAEWTDVFLPAGYAQSRWPVVAAAWAAWESGDLAPVTGMHTAEAESGDNGYAIYLAVQCTDARWPLDYAVWRKDGFATAQKAPFETWGNVWFNMPCMFWQAPQGDPVEVDGSKTPEALLVNTTLDGATPYAGALEVRRRFPNSALVAEIGNTTHSHSLSGNSCVDGAVFDYLRDGRLPDRQSGPGPDVRCMASPLPEAGEPGLVGLLDAV